MAETPRAGQPGQYDGAAPVGDRRAGTGPAPGAGDAPHRDARGHSHARGDAVAAGHIADDTGPQPPPVQARHPDSLTPPPVERTSGAEPAPSGAAGDPSPGARALQARSLHDHGQYTDKIPVSDPAMSPLGTDSEAAGQHVPEGAREPMAPMDAPAANNHRPAGHARGEVPQGATPWIWILGSLVLILAAGVAALAALD